MHAMGIMVVVGVLKSFWYNSTYACSGNYGGGGSPEKFSVSFNLCMPCLFYCRGCLAEDQPVPTDIFFQHLD